MKSTRKEDVEVLKFVTCLRILLFLNNRSIVHFLRKVGGEGVKKLVTFCGCRKCMTPYQEKASSQLAITCSKLIIETLEQGVKYVQSQQ